MTLQVEIPQTWHREAHFHICQTSVRNTSPQDFESLFGSSHFGSRWLRRETICHFVSKGSSFVSSHLGASSSADSSNLHYMNVHAILNVMRPFLGVLIWVATSRGADAESHQPRLGHDSSSSQGREGPFYTICYGWGAEGYGPFATYREAEQKFTSCREIKYPVMITPVAEFCAEYHSDCKELKYNGPTEVAFKHNFQRAMKIWWELKCPLGSGNVIIGGPIPWKDDATSSSRSMPRYMPWHGMPWHMPLHAMGQGMPWHMP